MPVDLVQRFSRTPLVADLILNCVPVRVATNSQLLLDRLVVASTTSKQHHQGVSVVEWRIVVEDEQDASSSEPASYGFTHDGLSLIRIAHRSFLASDRQTRLGISFISRELIEEAHLFDLYFFPALMSIMAEMKQSA